MRGLKKKHTIDMERHLKVIGGRKMANRAIKDANALNAAKSDPDTWNKIVNYGLPEITDLDGPAEC